MCGESEVLKVKVPLICPSTAGVLALRDGRYSVRKRENDFDICWLLSRLPGRSVLLKGSETRLDKHHACTN
jgi:hypothetical protein